MTNDGRLLIYGNENGMNVKLLEKCHKIVASYV